MSGVDITLAIPQWNWVQRVVVYRKRVFHKTHRNFQCDLFSTDDGHFEYSAVATSMRFGVAALWGFMAGRGGHDKTFGELKQNLAFDAIPGLDRQANALWQQLSVLTHNLVCRVQLFLGAPARPRSRKRTFALRSLQTLRVSSSISRPGSCGRPVRAALGRISRHAASDRAGAAIDSACRMNPHPPQTTTKRANSLPDQS